MPTTRSIGLALDHRGFSEPLLSLRGIAALMVLVFHSMLSFKIGGIDPQYFRLPNGTSGSMIADQLVVFLTNGGAAVTFFFVHSGFVLSLSLDKSYSRLGGATPTLILSFYIKRLFRLYPVIFVASVLGFLAVTHFYTASPSTHVSQWYMGFFANGSEGKLGDALKSAASIGSEFNQFAWSLRLEFLISIVMPFLFLAMRHRLSSILFLGALFFADKIGPYELSGGYIHGFFATFVLCFVAGLTVGTLKPIVGRMFSDSSRLRAGLFCDLLTLASFLVLVIARPLLSEKHTEAAIMIETLTSMPIIYCTYYVEAGRFYHFCNHVWVRFLGRISYSLYMVGSVSIYVAVKIVNHAYGDVFIGSHGLLSNLSAAFLAIGIATVFSAPCYSWVEVPLTNLGKSIGDRIGARLGRRSVQAMEAEGA